MYNQLVALFSNPSLLMPAIHSIKWPGFYHDRKKKKVTLSQEDIYVCSGILLMLRTFFMKTLSLPICDNLQDSF